jgi:hypothetical protein
MTEHRSALRIPSLPDERRANRFAIGHDTFQFKFDFWLSIAAPDERGVTRIMTTPDIALEFSSALRASLRDYRRRMGRLIPDPLGDEER